MSFAPLSLFARIPELAKEKQEEQQAAAVPVAPKNKGISCEAIHMYRVVKGVKYRTTSSFLMDQKAKRLNRYKRVKKDIIPEYFKNHISKDDHTIENRARALQRHLERLNLDFAEAA